ncbi:MULTISPECIES: hypothetical protein [unclassified Methylobacterium]|uniref:hypothetical protein n=1 Tax=unclassified Methylobacterium TaxID=2615210 RepID=UPI0011C206BB|nr:MULTISPECIES: hypothetical protein [unclassified Methylobacterium]QEE39862.1 hypothetical protein FVA80_13750 [Methylobacterium sp. WL1]TXN57294.1 hypothetical protein FV241_11560 [Methylobacterium sp. WL2]
MTLWLALRRLLPLLAVLSLALTPVTAPAATVGMHASIAHEAAASMPVVHHGMVMDHAEMGAMDMAEMAMDDMPCCPKETAKKPDCTKGCPLMALCFASAASLLPGTVAVPAPVASRATLSWPASASFASVHGTPLPEPPRA